MFLNLNKKINSQNEQNIDTDSKINLNLLPLDYSVPNGADIGINLKYSSDLAKHINKDEIKEFFKENQIDIIVDILEDDNYKEVTISNNDFSISAEYWIEFDDSSKDFIIEGYEEDNDEWKDEIINILKGCNLDVLFTCRSSEEVIIVFLLAIYFSKYTDFIIVSDTYNGLDLKIEDGKLVVFK